MRVKMEELKEALDKNHKEQKEKNKEFDNLLDALCELEEDELDLKRQIKELEESDIETSLKLYKETNELTFQGAVELTEDDRWKIQYHLSKGEGYRGSIGGYSIIVTYTSIGVIIELNLNGRNITIRDLG